MSAKRFRHNRILSIIREGAVGSQEDLAAQLHRAGIEATQSTLSRDIRDLGLVKVRGHYREAAGLEGPPPTDELRRAFQQLVVRTGLSGNILMFRTAPGNAHALAVVLDAARWPEIMGTVAGDDTVFALLESDRLGRRLLKRVEDYLS